MDDENRVDGFAWCILVFLIGMGFAIYVLVGQIQYNENTKDMGPKGTVIACDSLNDEEGDDAQFIVTIRAEDGSKQSQVVKGTPPVLGDHIWFDGKVGWEPYTEQSSSGTEILTLPLFL